ncbi:MAG: hypothetical protein LUH53_07885 [Lachnospiraceae bacterium]|nr:hypothetical protein [Lachnospiraceae bacterium]
MKKNAMKSNALNINAMPGSAALKYFFIPSPAASKALIQTGIPFFTENSSPSGL